MLSIFSPHTSKVSAAFVMLALGVAQAGAETPAGAAAPGTPAQSAPTTTGALPSQPATTSPSADPSAPAAPSAQTTTPADANAVANAVTPTAARNGNHRSERDDAWRATDLRGQRRRQRRPPQPPRLRPLRLQKRRRRRRRPPLLRLSQRLLLLPRHLHLLLRLRLLPRRPKQLRRLPRRLVRKRRLRLRRRLRLLQLRQRRRPILSFKRRARGSVTQPTRKVSTRTTLQLPWPSMLRAMMRRSGWIAPASMPRPRALSMKCAGPTSGGSRRRHSICPP